MRLYRLAGVFVFFLFLVPFQAHALALGDIRLHSALNQPLDAEVKLLSLGEIGLDEISVRLAPPEAFDRVGLDRPFFLTGLRFELAEKDGTPYLYITTKQPLKEPFIDFLIEVEWPNGRLLREYTLLLDPPVFLEDGPTAVEAPQAAAPAAPAPLPAVSPEAPRSATATSGAAMTTDGLSYGPVRRTDTLWSIAKRMRPDESVTVPQVMVALLENNPEAFYHRNVNYLKAGYILRLPDPSAPAAVDPVEAERLIRLQNQQWEDARRQRAGGALKRPEGGEAEPAGRSDPAGGARAGESAAPAQASARPRLRLVVPEDMEAGETAIEGVADKTAAGASPRAELDALRRELALALETSAASRQENADLRERLAALEEQIAAMQRLLSLRDDTLAALQSGVAARQDAAGTAGVAGEGLRGAGVEPAEETGLAAGQEGEVSQAAAQPAPKGERAGDQAVTSAARDPVRQAASAPEEETPAAGGFDEFFAQLLADPMLTAAAGGVGLLVLALAWVAVRRRQRGDDDPEAPGDLEDLARDEPAAASEKEGAPAVATDQAAAVSAVVAEIGETVPESGESVGLDVFQPEEDEIDTLAEADVYLAYRRFDKAEELLKEAIAQEPQRHDYVLKLMEVYAASENRDDFLVQAEALRAALDGEGGEVWDKAVKLGRQLLPDHPLFATGSATGPAAGSAAGIATGIATGIAGGAGAEAPLAEEPAGEETTSPEVPAQAPAPAAQEAEEGLDVQLAGLSPDLDRGLDGDLEEAPADGSQSRFQSRSQSRSQSGDDDGFAALQEEAGFESILSGGEATGDKTEGSGEEAAPGDDDGPAFADFNVGEPDRTAAFQEEEVLDFDLDLSALDEQAKTASPPADLPLANDQGAAVQADSEDGGAETDRSEEAVAGKSPNVEPDVEGEGGDEAPAGGNKAATAVSAESAGDEETSGAETDLEADIDWLANLGDEDLDVTLEPETGAEAEAEPDLISGEDEVSTKLDLARAYIDMGDQESARSILGEVLHEGNDDQKGEAEELMRQIG